MPETLPWRHTGCSGEVLPFLCSHAFSRLRPCVAVHVTKGAAGARLSGAFHGPAMSCDTSCDMLRRPATYPLALAVPGSGSIRKPLAQ